MSPSESSNEIQVECFGAAELADDRNWWAIYATSFPPEEREPAEVILRSVRTGAGLAFRARHGDETVAIATTHLLRRPGAAFLVYLAVESRHRVTGTGGRLLEHAWSTSAARLRERGIAPIGLIWEVDLPGAGSGPADDSLRRRRISFFERHGGVRISRTYRQPPVNGSDSVPMQLMFRPASGSMPDSDAIADLVRAMYFEKYVAVNGIAAETVETLLLESDACHG